MGTHRKQENNITKLALQRKNSGVSADNELKKDNELKYVLKLVAEEAIKRFLKASSQEMTVAWSTIK